jgi:hypothetical protein
MSTAPKRAAQTVNKRKMDAARKRVEQQRAERQERRLAAAGADNGYARQVAERSVGRKRAEQRSEGRVLLSADDLWLEFGIRFSKVQLWKQVKLGLFPAPIKISANRNAWIRDEVVAWIAARMDEREVA